METSSDLFGVVAGATSSARPHVPGKVSIVIPVYNEEANLPLLLPRLLPVLAATGHPYEVVFSDDGSRDGSLRILKQAAAEHPGILKVVELVRNAGQHMAIMAAFTATDGEYVITLDADLQNPPEEIPKVLRLMTEGYDVVGTIRQGRRDTLFRRWASRLVNRTTALITGMRLGDYGCMLRGYHRDIVDVMSASDEASTFIPALAQQYARKPIEVQVAHSERAAGESKYSLYRLVRLNFDLMTGFSLVPLQIFSLLGFFVSLSGVALGFLLIYRRLRYGAEVEGVFTLFALAFIVMGVLMAGIGIVGEYVGRIYLQVRGRPRYLIRRVHGARAARAVEPALSARGETTNDGEGFSMSGIVIAGYSDVGYKCTKWLLDAGEEVRLVYTHPDDPRETRWFGSMVELARGKNVPAIVVADLSAPAEAARIKAVAPDFLFSFYFRKLIPLSVLGLASKGALNMHGSLLPRYRGRSPVNWAILNGADTTGATLHYMTDKADAGDVVEQEPVSIGPDDDALTVSRHVGDAAVKVLARALPLLKSGQAPRVPQDHAKASKFGGRKPEDGFVDWGKPAKQVHDLVRAVSQPWPGAFTDLFGSKVTIWKTRLSPYGGHDVFPGKVELTEHSVIVYCGDDRIVEVLSARPEGGGDLDAGQFRAWVLTRGAA